MIFAHMKDEMGVFSCQFLMTFLNKLLRMTNLHMRSKEFRAAVSRILGQFVLTLCQAYFVKFYANINKSFALAGDVI